MEAIQPASDASDSFALNTGRSIPQDASSFFRHF
jgi:hypothetical protein